MSPAVYLVGGAVRDDLLGIPHKERDWVVVGGTPEELLDRGYRQVGSSFPVFLHPETGEEYALARTERKSGHGYHGFEVDFDPGVTLEQDLERRDLTINAMARDGQGQLIDPFGGQRDLEARVLRHVSDAFAEDPLRVLRVARFAARFAELGFTVDDSTMRLMRIMTESGELAHLVPERVWAEIELAMGAPVPCAFVEVLRQCGALAVLLPEVDCLFGVPQPEQFHPEIDTGEHVLMAMNLAGRARWSPEVVFALLLHDLGKGLTPRSQWPSHIGHEQAGLELVERVCDRYRAPNAFRRLALKVCLLHLKCHRVGEMKPGALLRLIEAADLLRQPGLFGDFSRACEADYRGRKGFEQRPYPQVGLLKAALDAALGVRAADLDTSGMDGEAIGEAVRRARIDAIAGVSGRKD
jgi:tRNA nucleotidyltransferase (CCA-adding enzyme)